MNEVGLIAQRRRINRVVDAIYKEPAGELDLARLADIACLSKFHFGRVFSRHMGETPVAFIWRTRLEQAALSLDYGLTTSVTETALSFGFSSPEAFSRGFAGRFGVAPRHFRRANQAVSRWHSSAVIEASNYLGGPKTGMAAPPGGAGVTIEKIPDQKVAYLRHRGPYNVYKQSRNGISMGFVALKRWASRHGLLDGKRKWIGLALNSSRLTLATACLYDICIPIEDDIPENEGLGIQTIPGGTFAVLRLACTAPEMADHWNWLSRAWVPASGVVRALAPSFERYPVNLERADPDLIETELCLRLESR